MGKLLIYLGAILSQSQANDLPTQCKLIMYFFIAAEIGTAAK